MNKKEVENKIKICFLDERNFNAQVTYFMKEVTTGKE